MLNYKIVSTAVLLSAQCLIRTSAAPLQAEGTSCHYMGCEADGTSRAFCQGGSATVPGQVKLCAETEVCIVTNKAQGNFYCGPPGQTTSQASEAQPSVTPIGFTPSQSTTSSNGITPATMNAYPDGWKDKTARKDNRITYYEEVMDLKNTACGGEAVAYNKQEPYIVAMDVGFFGDKDAPGYNPNKASVCGKKIKLSYGGKSIDLVAVDRCPVCPKNGLDIAPDAFLKLFGSLDAGTLSEGTSWSFV